jgi:hypothetical protein
MFAAMRRASSSVRTFACIASGDNDDRPAQTGAGDNATRATPPHQSGPEAGNGAANEAAPEAGEAKPNEREQPEPAADKGQGEQGKASGNGANASNASAKPQAKAEPIPRSMSDVGQ